MTGICRSVSFFPKVPAVSALALLRPTSPTLRLIRRFGSVSGGSRMLHVVDCHAGGEPARVVVGGWPHVPGSTMYEKRNYMMENQDDLRKLLLLEPRGYPCQNANVILPPTIPTANYGYVILEQNKIYPAMSGHNTICVATALLETGMVPISTTSHTTSFTLEAPAGPIDITAHCENGKAVSITLKNTPSFLVAKDVKVNVPELGTTSSFIVI